MRPRRVALAGAAALVALAGPAVASPGVAGAEETPPPDPTVEEVVVFNDTEIVESSGLVVQDGYLVTVNDSGDSARLFTVDPETGDTVGVTRWPLAVYDVEGLAPAGNGEVWVGDIGDNFQGRESIQVHRVPIGPGERTAVSASYELDYPDGRRDAEALLRHPTTGQLFVVSKEAVAGRIYAVPEEPDPDGLNRMRGVGAVLPVATGGEFFPDGEHVLIRSYGKAAVYTWPDLEEVAMFDLPRQEQGEAAAVDGRGRVLLSSEGLRQPVLRLTLPEELANRVRGIDAPPEGEAELPDAGEPVVEGEPVWPWLFMGGMGLVVLYGAVHLVRAGFFREE